MIGSVYDYYLTTYASKPATKSDTHKKADLKNLYNNIVNISKKSPLYKINVSEDVQKYVIDLKENARFLLDDINNLVFDTSSIHNYKYTSGNEDIVSVNSLPNTDNSSGDISFEDYSIEVNQLASPQVNTGNYLKEGSLSFSRGEHSFEITLNNTTYEFQFNVSQSDTNDSVLEKLSRLINRSNIGVTANTLHSSDSCALEITSDSTGVSLSPTIFTISKSINEPKDNTLDILGIDTITAYPSNAKFTLNGAERTSSGNTFTINKSFEITLKTTTEKDSPITINRRNDFDSVFNSISELVSDYNNIIDISKSKSSDNGDAAKLHKEMKATVLQNKNALESVGLTIQEDGSLSFDEAILLQSIKEGSLDDTLSHLSTFKDNLQNKLNDITIDPMKYVNKTMISYPHPVKAFANPYVTSIYSGMMFNGYI